MRKSVQLIGTLLIWAAFSGFIGWAESQDFGAKAGVLLGLGVFVVGFALAAGITASINGEIGRS